MVSTREKVYLWGAMSRSMRLATGVGRCCRVGRSAESLLRRASRSDSVMVSSEKLALLEVGDMKWQTSDLPVDAL